jgi:lipid-A-disaccharide synthase
VITYRMHPVTWQIMKRMAYQPWVSLPNILCRSRAWCPNCCRTMPRPEKLADAIDTLLGDSAAPR